MKKYFWLRYILAIQIALGAQLAFAAPESSSASTSTDNQIVQEIKDLLDGNATSESINQTSAEIGPELETTAEELENSTETSLPPAADLNGFYLAGQTATINGDTYNLSQLNISLPTVTVSDFDQEIQITADRAAKTLTFTKRKGDKIVATQTIRGLDIVSMARDKVLLQMIDSSGKILAIDLAFTRSRLVLFQTPIPVFTVGQIPNKFMPAIENLQTENVSRQRIAPINGVAQGAVLPVDVEPAKINDANFRWTAGDMILTTKTDRELVGLYRRDVTLKHIEYGFGVLHALAYAMSPEGQSDAALNAYSDPTAATQMIQIKDSLDAGTRTALTAFTPQVMAQAMTRLGFLKQSLTSPRDQFLFNEWQRDFVAAQQKAVNEETARQAEAARLANQSALQRAGSFTYSTLVEKGWLKRIAMFSSLAGAAYGVHEGLIYAADPHAAAWAVYVANKLYKIFPVLENRDYRVYMAAGMSCLASLVAFNWSVGSLFGRKLNWDFRKTLSTFGIRVAAFLQYNFAERLTDLLGQKTFFVALRNGISPFGKIKTDSRVGRAANLQHDTRPGLMNPFASAETRKSEFEHNRAVIAAAAQVQNRRQALAGLLANLVIAERFGIDPVTLIMAEKGEIKESDLESYRGSLAQVYTNPVLRERYKKLAAEIASVIDDIPELAQDIANINPKRLVDLYQIAKETAQKIKSRNRAQSAVANLQLKWREFTRYRFTRAVGNWGYREYQFLSHVEPTKFVSQQSWEQFYADFLFTILQVPLIGDRAKPGNPGDLAHGAGYLWPFGNRAGYFAYTTPGHLSDMGMQYGIYGISVPARTAQVYGDKAISVHEDAYDPAELVLYQTVENPEKFWPGLWGGIKGAANLTRAQYGRIFYKGMMRQLKSQQLSFVIGMFNRLLIVGQPFSQAIFAYIYGTAMGQWLFAWPWVPITRGIELYTESLDGKNARFTDAKIKLSQGIRFNDQALLNEGYSEIQDIYRAHTKPDDKVQAALVQTGNLLALSPQQLLEYSRYKAPFPNEINHKVSVFLNYSGSFITTLWGTNMFVKLYHPINSAGMAAKGIVVSGLIYAGLLQAQRNIDNFSKTMAYIALRKTVPNEAFAMALANHPRFDSLAQYAEWLKSQPTSPAVVQQVSTEALTSLLQEEANSRVTGESGLLRAINAAQKPTIAEIKTCASLLQAGEIRPMSFQEKAAAYWKGIWSPPTK